MRRNGWERPYHTLQMSTWILFPVILAIFFNFITPFLEAVTSITLSVIYALVALFVVLSTYKCAQIDPADRGITEAAATRQSAGAEQTYCHVCRRFVQAKSRHCRLCDKCICVFDHHCKWLNNCIGLHNYRLFCACVFGTLLLFSLQLSLHGYVLYSSIHHPDTIRARAGRAYGCARDSGKCLKSRDFLFAFKCVQGAMIVLFLFAWLLVCQLAYFHMMLSYNGFTTYDYILLKRKQKTEGRHTRGMWAAKWICCLNGYRLDICSMYRRQDIESAPPQNEHVDGAIEAEIDDELEVSSVTSKVVPVDSEPMSGMFLELSNVDISGEAGSVDVKHAPSQRGFGRHVNLGQLQSSREANIRTPISPTENAGYRRAPTTPMSSIEKLDATDITLSS